MRGDVGQPFWHNAMDACVVTDGSDEPGPGAVTVAAPWSEAAGDILETHERHATGVTYLRKDSLFA